MSRLSSIEKGGYYAFPDNHLPAVASLFTPAKHGGKLLDPCAGEGRALNHLAEAWGLTAYANELDVVRAAACHTLFGPARAVQGDLYRLRASSAAFSVVWCNPPYTYDSTGDDKRREFAMLKYAWKWVQPGGFVVWVVYSHHVTPQAAQFLAKRSRQIDIFRIPGLHLGEYVQVVVVAQAGEATHDPATLVERLIEAERSHAFPDLVVQPIPCYEIPDGATTKQFVFAPDILTPEVSLAAIESGGAQFSGGLQLLMRPEPSDSLVTPIVRPRAKQLGLLLAAGLFNGLILDTDSGRIAVRSTVVSVEELVHADPVDESNEHSIEREVYRTQAKTTITLLHANGDLRQLSSDGELIGFIQAHKAALLAYLDEHFAPLYNFDYSALAPTLARAKFGKLFATQKHVIAACHTALQTRRGILLVGEPGVGKTAMGGTLAATLRPQMKLGQVVIVMSPPHLVEKWKRELLEAAPGCQPSILRRVEDVTAFMRQAGASAKLHIGIISRESAKLGEGWEAAVQWKRRHIARWPRGEQPPKEKIGLPRVFTLTVPICPACGEPVTRDSDGKDPATDAWLNATPRECRRCGGALWTQARTFSAGKDEHGKRVKPSFQAPCRPSRNPRVPLADFIAKRYPGRVFLALIDEIHECKSTATDQGDAMMALANAAEKVVGLTGTVYGGVASSMYGLEFIFNPTIRARYPWGKGMSAWVRDMGALERLIEYRAAHDQSGKYTGKRRMEQRPKEAPGCSPLLLKEIIDHCVFVGLADVGKAMPAYTEIPVPIDPDPDVAALYFAAKDKLGKYVSGCLFQGDASPMAMYLQTLLNWPDAPYREEHCVHRWRPDREKLDLKELEVHTIPGLAESKLYAKEEWLLDTVRAELAEGRGVALFCRQTGERDIQPRIAKLLGEHIPAARPFILTGRVDAAKREEVLQRQVASGTNVLICNPKLVQTGLDLLDFPTIIFLEVDYSLFVMSQAARRAWRLIQDKECRTYFPYYVGLMEERAVQIIANKQAAANLLYGEGDGGLSALGGEGDNANLLAALAQSIDRDEATPDLRALFAQHAHTVDPSESAWFVADQAEQALDNAATEPNEALASIPCAQPGQPLMLHLVDTAPAIGLDSAPSAPKVTLAATPDVPPAEPLMSYLVETELRIELTAPTPAIPPAAQGFLFDMSTLTVKMPPDRTPARRKIEPVPLTAESFAHALKLTNPLVEALGAPTLTAIAEQLATIGNQMRHTHDRSGARAAIRQILKREGYPRRFLAQAAFHADLVCRI